MWDKFERLKPTAKRRLISCNQCRRKSIHNALARFQGTVFGDGMPDGYGEEHGLYRCGGCDSIIFIRDHWEHEDHFTDDNGEIDFFVTTKQYPPVLSNLSDIDTSDCPESIRNIVQEAASSLDNNNLLAATILARMTVEEICNDLGVKGRNLQQKIDSLCSSLSIDDEQKSLIHEIRIRGNDGAHKSRGMSAAEVKAGFEILALVIDKRYSSPARASRAVESAKRQLRKSKKN